MKLDDIPKDNIKEISLCGISVKVELNNGTSFIFSHQDTDEFFKWLNEIKNDKSNSNS